MAEPDSPSRTDQMAPPESAAQAVDRAVTRLYLVRHGETDWNATQRCQGTVDVPLNASGRNQAEVLANALRDVRFDAAYTSPLERARRTAETILRRSDVRVTSMGGLCEMSYGAWQGLTPGEWPDDAQKQWLDDPWRMTFPEGESLEMVRERVGPAIDEIVSGHPGETVLISGHGHANRVILIGAGYGTPESFWDIAQPNGGAWVLEYDARNTRATTITQLDIHSAASQPASAAASVPL